MEMENIIKLIETVSESNLTSFQYIEGESSLTLEINRNQPPVQNIEVQAQPVIRQVSEGVDKQEESSKPTVTSPMVGTFYAAKAEGAAPFVSVGDVVKKGQIIGIVEAMKLMNEIESPHDGVVEEILVKNKDMVEYGQTLITLR